MEWVSSERQRTYSAGCSSSTLFSGHFWLEGAIREQNPFLKISLQKCSTLSQSKESKDTLNLSAAEQSARSQTPPVTPPSAGRSQRVLTNNSLRFVRVRCKRRDFLPFFHLKDIIQTFVLFILRWWLEVFYRRVAFQHCRKRKLKMSTLFANIYKDKAEFRICSGPPPVTRWWSPQTPSGVAEHRTHQSHSQRVVVVVVLGGVEKR